MRASQKHYQELLVAMKNAQARKQRFTDSYNGGAKSGCRNMWIDASKELGKLSDLRNKMYPTYDATFTFQGEKFKKNVAVIGKSLFHNEKKLVGALYKNYVVNYDSYIDTTWYY